jgi:hypothetical protein
MSIIQKTVIFLKFFLEFSFEIINLIRSIVGIVTKCQIRTYISIKNNYLIFTACH